jgi:hypothetical protein
MCSSDAQSIAAPPPMFPADDAELRGCDDDAQKFSVTPARVPTDRLYQLTPSVDHEGVLPAPLLPPRASARRTAIEPSQQLVTVEHRWQGLRPPRA